MQQPVSERDLRNQLEDMTTRYPRLKDDELFLAWFIHAAVTADEKEAVDALTGHARDKGTDAVLVDDRAKVAFVIQGKYHKKVSASNEPRNDVLSFARLSESFYGTDAEFGALLEDIDPRVDEKLKHVRECLKKRSYRLKLYYATSGKCSANIITDAERICRRSGGDVDFEVWDGKRILLTLSDYLDGVAPPVPTLDLPLEVGHGVDSGWLKRHDQRSNITSWIFSMNASAVADIYEQAGIRLFARNVRGFLGKTTEVNRGMTETLDDEPLNFWYYNNGVTIICDRAEHISAGPSEILRVYNPQIINGQQTTRTLHEAVVKGTPAAVLVRAIVVPREPQSNSDRFETLVSHIVEATNRQNAIGPADLMSNDRRQIEIERELRKFNYYYLRKRQAKAEVRRFVGPRQEIVRKEEIAQAVAACELDPSVVRREGKDGLFEEHLYSKVFPTSDPHFYLNRYQVKYEVDQRSRHYPERGYAKWVVLHYIWKQLSPIIRSRSSASVFRDASDWDSPPIKPLREAINTVFRAALTFYRQNRGHGEQAVDVSRFFQRRGLADEFERYLRGNGRNFHSLFRRRLEQFEAALKKSDNEKVAVPAVGSS